MSDITNQPFKVLIIDDDPRMLFTLHESLDLLGGFAVVTAEDGVQGLRRYYEEQPDCLIIDIRMPNLDGYQLIRTLRGDPASAMTPLVVLTAMAQERDRFAGMASGADRYLTKPIRPADLVQAIHEAIAVSQEMRAQQMKTLFDELGPE